MRDKKKCEIVYGEDNTVVVIIYLHLLDFPWATTTLALLEDSALLRMSPLYIV